MKRVLLLLLGVMIGSSAFALRFSYTYAGQELTYDVTGDKTCEVVSYSSSVSGDLIIPDYAYDGTDEYQVTAIGKRAFYDSENIESVTIGNSVTKIGEEAFLHCWDLTTLRIGDGVKTIGKRAFLNCPGLESVHLGNSIETIGEEAFESCYALNSLNEIPASVTAIGTRAFVACYELTGFKVSAKNPNYCSVNGVLYNKSKTTLIQYFDNNGRVGYTIPNTVNTIGEYAFSGFSDLTYIDIPNSVTTIESDAFSGCGFTSVTIPNSVTIIGKMAFCNCMDLKSVTIPNSVDRIEYCCFFCCYALKTVEIPSSVMSIDSEAFGYCRSLTKIKVAADVPPACISTNVFNSNAYNNAMVLVPAKSVDEYKTADVWSGFKKIVADPNTGIDNVKADTAGVKIYNLGGAKVGNSLDGLPKGVYIMRQGSKTTKIVI